MPQEVNIKITADKLHDISYQKGLIAQKLKLQTTAIQSFQIIKKSIDARKKPIHFELRFVVFLNDETEYNYFEFNPSLQDVSKSPEVYIAGSGPAGLFAALELICQGFKPIIIERGKNVQERRRDLAAMNKEGIINPDSNYCFGEGGAGTYSDGKLYTRSGKRGNIQNCLLWFHYFGADENILYTGHPHIGTNKLPHIIARMREQIIACGGEVLFHSKLTDFTVSMGKLQSITINGNETINCSRLILATGHSARDIFHLFHKKQLRIESKPFALGVRIEHPQELINEIQYKCGPQDPIIDVLGAASYSLVSQELGRGVFSFCMCPGGIIAPASTEHGALVVNGWSPSKRNGLYANSGMVVAVDEKDFSKYHFTGDLAAMNYQNMVEVSAWQFGGGNLVAPAQRLTDFVNKKFSNTLPNCSYIPGITPALMNEVLPIEVFESLKRGFYSFGSKLKGYLTSEAIVTATESRTSSPVRIPRTDASLEHVQVTGLYPCGEGAGYAGGIISAAMDGIRVAKAIAGNLG